MFPQSRSPYSVFICISISGIRKRRHLRDSNHLPNPGLSSLKSISYWKTKVVKSWGLDNWNLDGAHKVRGMPRCGENALPLVGFQTCDMFHLLNSSSKIKELPCKLPPSPSAASLVFMRLFNIFQPIVKSNSNLHLPILSNGVSWEQIYRSFANIALSAQSGMSWPFVQRSCKLATGRLWTCP